MVTGDGVFLQNTATALGKVFDDRMIEACGWQPVISRNA